MEAHAHSFGTIAVTGPPGARVYVDGRPRGTLPIAGPIVTTGGVRRLRVVARQHPVERDVTVKLGAETRLAIAEPPLAQAASPQPPRRARRPRAATSRAPERPVPSWPYVGMIGGGALSLAGLVGIVASSSALVDKRKTLGEQCVVPEGDQCLATTTWRKSGAHAAAHDIAVLKGWRWASIAGTVLGGGAAVVGLVAVVSSDSPSFPRSDARLLLSGEGAGIEWCGAF